MTKDAAKKRPKASSKEPSDIDEFWRNPIFRDPDAFIDRVKSYIDIFGTAHVAIPKKGPKAKFINEIKKLGYRMVPIKADPSKMLSEDHIKRLKFYAISRG